MTFFIEITQGLYFTDVEIVDSCPRYSLSVCLLVSQLKIWRTALTIFLIFGMNVPYYKTKKRTRPFFREKSGSFNNHKLVFLNDPISYRPIA